MRLALRFNIAFVFIAAQFFSYSQLQVKNFFSLTGKKDHPINVISQDSQGFLWLGSKDGLYKFDGRSATELMKDSRLLKRDITALHIDRRNQVWIGTAGGKVFTLRNNRLDSLDFGPKPNTERITSFCELDSGMCIGTYGNGIFILSNRAKLKQINTSNDLGDNVVYVVAGDGRNSIWCGTDAGISQLGNVFGTTTASIISNNNGLPDNIVRGITYLNGHILISMQDSGVCAYDPIHRSFNRSLVQGAWDKGPILAAYMPAPGRLFLGTEKNGLVYVVNGKTQAYDYTSTIQSSGISHLFADNTGQVWLASKKGISQFSEKRYSLIHNISGLAGDRILAITSDNNMALWVGTTMGVSRLDNGPGGSMAMGASHELSKYTISCAAKAPDGSIWYGSYGNGIIILSPAGKNTLVLNSQNSDLANDNISHIYFHGRETAYISTLGGGLIMAKLQDNPAQPFKVLKTYTEESGLGNSYVYSAVTDSKGRLFVGTDGGGLQLLENGKFTDLVKKHRLMSNTVFSLCRDQDDAIWAVSNADGILKYRHDSLWTIGLAEGLRELQPPQIIAVENTLYAFNSRGIDKIDCRTNAVSYYDLFDTDIEPNLNAVSYSNGRIYSGTNNGILVFRTYHEHLDSIKPTAFIKSLSVNYKPYPLDSVREFNYKQNSMAIAFDGIWPRNPDKLLFRYRLKGLEDEWQYSNEGKTINYNNLAPGEYAFMAQCKNEEEIWSEPVEYRFVVLTPLWKRWWFWLLVITAGFTGIYAFFRYRIETLKRANLLLEQRVAERTSEIEAQSRIIEAKNRELEQLSLVASKTDNVVLILDAEGRLEYVNQSFLNLNKLSREDLVKTYGETIYEFSNNPNIRDLVHEAVSQRRSVYYESINRKVHSETDIWESSTLTPIFNEDGELRKIIIIDTDVSEIKRQEQIITQKNKDITDSISYARKIQHAILPRDSVIRQHVPESFVLYLTKDIVSGDFYWFGHMETFSIIAAVDCTGHGVPGAFMSLIGYSLLNRIINEKKITDPSEILLELNEGVLGILHKNESESKDGMDIAICKINHGQNTLEYAGAMRPLWIISKAGELSEIKADKIPIGTKQKDREETIAYTTRTVAVQPGDSFYIFTDGFADQFGGTKDKKYSTGRFKELLIANAAYDFATQEQNIREEHLRWKSDNEQVDDILLIGFSL